MGFTAARAERAEAAVVVWTWGQDIGGVVVEVEAVGGVGAVAGTGVVCAVGHLAPVDMLNSEFFSQPPPSRYNRTRPTNCTRARTRTDHPSCIIPAANACKPDY